MLRRAVETGVVALLTEMRRRTHVELGRVRYLGGCIRVATLRDHAVIGGRARRLRRGRARREGVKTVVALCLWSTTLGWRGKAIENSSLGALDFEFEGLMDCRPFPLVNSRIANPWG
jgi:hypothetical protein